MGWLRVDIDMGPFWVAVSRELPKMLSVISVGTRKRVLRYRRRSSTTRGLAARGAGSGALRTLTIRCLVAVVVLSFCAVTDQSEKRAAVNPDSVETAAAVTVPEGNYVPLAKPQRVYSGVPSWPDPTPFTAIGVGSVPRANTTAVAVAVTALKANDSQVYVAQRRKDGSTANSTLTNSHYDGSEYPSSTVTATIPVDETMTTSQALIGDYNRVGGDAQARVDVLGYYTRAAAGGGYIPVRRATAFDTRSEGKPIPAGGQITRKLVGGPVPAGSSAAWLTMTAVGGASDGGLTAVPAGTNPNNGVVLRYTANSSPISNLVPVKLSSDGSVTFLNDGPSAVHLVVSFEGYTTDSPSTGQEFVSEERLAFGVYQPDDLEPNKPRVIDFSKQLPAYLEVDSVWLQLKSYSQSGGYLRVYPNGESPVSGSTLNIASKNTHPRDRISPTQVPLGTDGKLVFENVSGQTLKFTIDVMGFSRYASTPTPPVDDSRVAVARTTSGPCYSYLEQSQSAARVGCAGSYDEAQDTVYGSLGLPGQEFAGPVSAVARGNGRFIASAVHKSDGELWFWESPHASGGVAPTVIRSYRQVTNPLTTVTLPGGAPAGFTTDTDGQVWAVNLDVAFPNQPTWSALGKPPVAIVGPLDVQATKTGAQLFARTGAGDVLTAAYTAQATPQTLTWRSLQFTGASSRVGTQTSSTGQVRAVVRRGTTLWSITFADGEKSNGSWVQVNTTLGGRQVQVAGSPTVIFDPLSGRNAVMFRSDADGAGALYRTYETTAGIGVFDDQVSGVALGGFGIGTDVTAWDYRNETPLTRRYSFVFLDTAGTARGGTSTVPPT